MTSQPLSEYFAGEQFYSYFLNVAGYIHYELPGVFTALPAASVVNLQLWTVPYELECYALITILAVGGVIARPRMLAFVAALLAVFVTGFAALNHQFPPMDYPPTGKVCVLSFLFGVVLYAGRRHVPFSFGLFLAAAIFSWLSLLRPETGFFAGLPVAYATVWLGLQNPAKIFLINGADYSYGMYLYGFPIQQTVAYAFPEYRVWYFDLALSLLFAGLCAFLSWNLIEQPVQEKRKRVLAFVNRTVDRFRRPDIAAP